MNVTYAQHLENIDHFYARASAIYRVYLAGGLFLHTDGETIRSWPDTNGLRFDGIDEDLVPGNPPLAKLVGKVVSGDSWVTCTVKVPTTWFDLSEEQAAAEAERDCKERIATIREALEQKRRRQAAAQEQSERDQLAVLTKRYGAPAIAG